jgi:hypothetical protein
MKKKTSQLLPFLTSAALLLSGLPSAALAQSQQASAPSSDTLEATAAAPGTPAPSTSIAPDTRPVTQEQFKELIKIYKKQVERFDKVESKVNTLGTGTKPGKPGGADEAVDLNGLTSADNGAAPVNTGSGGSHQRTGAGAVPDFKVYFDLNLINRPGVENFSFDSYHQFLFFEILPTPDIQFSFDVSTSPKYFELDYQITPKLQMRAGKIWIPFDDMSPHNIFGGRVNVSRLAVPNAPAFLPDLWTDLGIGAKYSLIDKPKFSLELHAYIVNGFRDGGKDAVAPNSPYPSFADLPTAPDNNRDKAIGGRVHTLIAQKVGLGFSYYNGRWNADGPNTVPMRLSIMGVDAQLRIKDTEFRTGLATMAVNLPTGRVANRGGAYVELGQKFGAKSDWKLLGRAGLLQLDDGVLDTSATQAVGDEQIVGGTILWKPSLIQYSIEYSQDLKYAPAKPNYSYTAARIVMAF